MADREKLINALIDEGYEDVVIFENPGYEGAFIGVTTDDRAVYDFDLMVEWLVMEEGMTEIEAVEWLEYNTMRALPYAGDAAPVIVCRLMELETDDKWRCK